MSASQSRLANIVAGILDSYAEHGYINHLEGSNLPSRAEVTELVDDLLSLLFPGYFDNVPPDRLSHPYTVGARCARVLRSLEHMIARAFGEPDAPLGPMSAAVRDSRPSCEQAFRLLEALPTIRSLLDTDVKAALASDPAARGPAEVVTSYPGIKAIAVHRLAHELYRTGVPLLPRMMSELVHGRTGIDIHPGAQIGPSFFVDHGTGVVIGETCRIGARVKLYQGVTLGALSIASATAYPTGEQRHPTLEDDVTVYAGATILGGQTVIGRGSIVGGNVWLTKSIAAYTTVIATPPSQRLVARNAQVDSAAEPGHGETTS